MKRAEAYRRPWEATIDPRKWQDAVFAALDSLDKARKKMRPGTHAYAAQTHRLALYEFDLLAKAKVDEILCLFVREKDVEETNYESWELTREFFPDSDFKGDHWKAIQCHEDRVDEAAAALEATLEPKRNKP